MTTSSESGQDPVAPDRRALSSRDISIARPRLRRGCGSEVALGPRMELSSRCAVNLHTWWRSPRMAWAVGAQLGPSECVTCARRSPRSRGVMSVSSRKPRIVAALVVRVAPGLPPARRLGAAPGLYELALAARRPRAMTVCVDTPPVTTGAAAGSGGALSLMRGRRLLGGALVDARNLRDSATISSHQWKRREPLMR